LEYIARAED